MTEPMTITRDELAAFESRLAEFAKTLNPGERARLNEILHRAIHGTDHDTAGYITPNDSLPSLVPFFTDARSDITLVDEDAELNMLKAPHVEQPGE